MARDALTRVKQKGYQLNCHLPVEKQAFLLQGTK